MPRPLFITGSDTGVGKTVLTALLVRFLRRSGQSALAVKPFCSGGREDAEILHAAQDGAVSLDAINPWHFPAPLTPLLAARKVRQTVPLDEVLAFLRSAHRSGPLLLVEGAGGLLSPLGDGYSARELLAGLRADAVVVCANRLGAINQARLTLGCLPVGTRQRARLVLMGQPTPDSAAQGNVDLLRELVGLDRVIELPHLPAAHAAPLSPALCRRLKAVLGGGLPQARGRPAGPDFPR